MRFYDLAITDPKTGKRTFHATSHPGGTYDPGALNVIFDLYVTLQAQPVGGSTIRIEGIDKGILSNAHQFSGQIVALNGGMAPGLPLADPSQQGLLAQGQAFQSFANWVGTQVDLSFVLLASGFTMTEPGPFVLNWTKGMTLAQALTNTLRTVYPKATVQMQIGSYVLSHDEKHVCSTLSGLANMVSDVTHEQVQIAINGNNIRVFDASFQPSPHQLKFTDFIGQPMWIEQNTIQSRLALRGDIQLGDIVKMPEQYQNLPGIVQTFATATPSQINYQPAIKGKFVVNMVRHTGDLRQPNGAAWCTTINAVTPNAAAATTPP